MSATLPTVIPAKAGTQTGPSEVRELSLGSRLRGKDGVV
jgi:hypothetical protein